MRYFWASASHKGRIRDNNEDTVFPEASGESESSAVLIVADGMGGHIAGEVASRLAVNTAASTDDDPVARVEAANKAIRDEIAREPSLEGMGTTMTLAFLEEGGLARLAHIGDSRAYLFRSGELRQITEDHTVAAEYVAQGKLSPDDAAAHPQRHMLTRTLGLTSDIEVDEISVALEPGDRLLLCSDGVTEMIPDERIAEILAEESPEEAVWELVETANEEGGVDNITAIVVEVAE
ncbi:MAG: Stp1/IreP family PP2C-type Ser/Thr phosphatase [Acidimicrobiia bacterium]